MSDFRLTSPSGLRFELDAHGTPRKIFCGTVLLNLFVGNEAEAGTANIYLARRGRRAQHAPLLGPLAGTRFEFDAAAGRVVGDGSWSGIDYRLELRLAEAGTAWFWHVRLTNTGARSEELELTYTQDIGLAPYGAARSNEYYVSQYIDHTALVHPVCGLVVASRQNLAVDGRHPWCLIGSLRRGVSYATDALQTYGVAGRAGTVTARLGEELPSRRLQHEHSLVAIADTPMPLEPGATLHAGFFGRYLADHPAATSSADLEEVAQALGGPAAREPASNVVFTAGARGAAESASLFAAAPLLAAHDLDDAALRKRYPAPWRNEERDEQGRLLAFFCGAATHVALRAKELRVLRPHGHILRTGRHLTPDESALTSTAWMGGVFHSMLTQGHVSINRLLSTVHTYLGLFRSHGQRVFVQTDDGWRLLHTPSAFAMTPDECRWVYRHDGGLLEVTASARSDPHELALEIEIESGPPARFLISHHVALDGDDGSARTAPPRWRRDGESIVLLPPPDTDVARRFPHGSFVLEASDSTVIEQVGGDELLYADGKSRGEPFVCVVTAPAVRVELRVRGRLVAEQSQTPLRVEPGEPLIPSLELTAPPPSPFADHVARLTDIAPWLTHDALVHYLSPRGLEQYSGGGWGTRDVCQGPVEMLLALDRTAPIRDLLLTVMRAQNPDGDWPQWFMFFERERNIRPGDSHGDIVLWPLWALAQYVVASGDGGILDERVPFFDARGPAAGESAAVWQHVLRALAVIERRRIAGTALAAYGHGDWNDSLQPADPALRERMCSAWTVTLHYQTLRMLARALREAGRETQAVPLTAAADAVRHDFQRTLVVDGVLTGYALFDDAAGVRCLLHPRDDTTGIHYSALAMIHAILEDLFTPAQAREHLELIERHLVGPDGVRLFDRPMPYHGGIERLFQRAETATFFGREIGLMYMHAHLRYAQALAHVGESERFFHALCQANPIGIRAIVPAATLRQSNCYYSSSDAAFADRYQAGAEYRRVASGDIALDGGWRVYSSGAGIALGLIVRHFLGLSCEARTLCLDPVMPPALDGLCARTLLFGHELEVRYRVGRTGHGVHAVALNAAALPFTHRDDNPHRRGAALVTKAAVLERLTAERNVLTIGID